MNPGFGTPKPVYPSEGAFILTGEHCKVNGQAEQPYGIRHVFV